jgi:hypothetical protein
MKRLALVLILACAAAAQETKPAGQGPAKIEITLELRDGSQWKAVDPALVFEKGDCVRFRFRAGFDGYLYVMDYGSSGSFALLFPRSETGTENSIEAEKKYQVPATQACFRVDGPPGYDVLYWLLSPVPLPGGAGSLIGPPAQSSTAPKRLLPRCDDSQMRARGLCIDSNAGPRNVTPESELPGNLSNVPRAQSRELVILKKQDKVSVSSPTPLSGPVIYEFRLAHK